MQPLVCAEAEHQLQHRRICGKALSKLHGADQAGRCQHLKALIDGLLQYYPTKFAVEDLAQAATTEDLVESIVEEALDFYEKHSESMPGGAETMRQIERDVYLQIMDARWRDHLTEMDNLKDGIHLRWTV